MTGSNYAAQVGEVCILRIKIDAFFYCNSEIFAIDVILEYRLTHSEMAGRVSHYY